MHSQYINEMLGIPELQIRQILPGPADEVHIEVTPISKKQCCPTCHSDHSVGLKGSNPSRLVRHLPGLPKIHSAMH